MKKYLLAIRRPDDSTGEAVLEKPVTRIGRSDDNDLILRHPSISRRHATITQEPDGSLLLTDLGSANGSLLNGNKVSAPVRVDAGDCIVLGGFQITFSELDTSAPFSIQTAGIDLSELQQNPRLLSRSEDDQGKADAAGQLRSLELLYEMGMTLARARSVEEVIEHAIKLLFKIEEVSRAGLLLWNPETNSFGDRGIHVRNGSADQTWSGSYDPKQLVMSRTILERVRRENRPLRIRDANADATLHSALSVVRAGIQAAFCAPLFSQNGLLGVLYADNLMRPDAFTDEDFRTFTAIAAQTGLALANAIASKELVRREVQREALKAYLPPQVADLILSTNGSACIAGSAQEVTVLFADIRNFTRISERLEASAVVGLLNAFFSEMSEILLRFDATIDKFIGDCIMALFGAPIPQADSADRAVSAAIEMQRWMRARQPVESLGRKLAIGIGLHTGQAVVGNVGSAERVQYTAIGDTVNVAARLVNSAEAGQILLSEDCRNSLAVPRDLETIGETGLKGRQQTVMIHAVRWE